MGSIRINGTSSGYVELQAPDVAGTTVVTLPTESTSLVNATPFGSVISFAGSTAPQGWLLCHGQAVSRTDYAELFAVIGTTYGVGDGSTTFNVPNLKGRIPVGLDSAQTEFDALNETGGGKTHTLTAAESGVPAHSHSASTGNDSPDHTHNLGERGGISVTGGSWGALVVDYSQTRTTTGASARHTHSVTVNNNTAANASAAHNNLQPYITLNYIIKAA